jgi:DNA-binding NtrC family response regulator
VGDRAASIEEIPISLQNLHAFARPPAGLSADGRLSSKAAVRLQLIHDAMETQRLALLVEDDEALIGELVPLIEDQGFTIAVRHAGDDPLGIRELRPAVALISCDTDLDLVRLLLDEDHLDDNSEVLLIGKSEQHNDSVQAWLAQGRAFFLARPLNLAYVKQLLVDIRGELDKSEGDAGSASRADIPLDQFGLLRGSSAPMRRIYRMLRRVAPTATSVLVCGESGTGKELVAETIHAASAQSDGPFLAINCGAIPSELVESELFGHEKGSFSGALRRHRGLFERADGGTLFLDEITEMPEKVQVKLLRVLETGKFRRVGGEVDQVSSVRIVAATNRSPEQAVASGKLREDLYFRVARFVLRLPPLRERGEDIVGLARNFLAELNEQHDTACTLSATAESALIQHGWPGNVRELRSAIEHAYLVADRVIDGPDLPDFAASEIPVDDGNYLRVSVGTSLDDTERRLIFATLQSVNGSKPDAAEALGISLKTLYNRLNRYNDEGAA